MKKKIEKMATMLRTHPQGCAFCVGSLDETEVLVVAAEWIEEGFTADAAYDWLTSGCFTAADAAGLRNAGLMAQQVSGDCPELRGYSWGYAYANSDVSLADVVAACKSE